MLGHNQDIESVRAMNLLAALAAGIIEQIAKLLQVYQVTEAGLLKEHLFARYRKLVCDIEERQRQEDCTERKNSSVGRWRLMRIPADVQDFMDYIRTCHGITCVYGAQYLQETNDAERRALLARMPFFAVHSDFKRWFCKSSGG